MVKSKLEIFQVDIVMTDHLNYIDALNYLDGLVDYSLMRNLQFSEEKFNLGRMNSLLELMGNPHQAYPVIHVAGTKGKGSTCAMIAGVLQEAGYKTGLYTSPHLLEYTERIQVNRNAITKQELAEIVFNLRPLAEQVEQITKFELTTAAAFTYFMKNKVDVAVIEVGLGGRLDATNVVTPLVSVITSLSYDHMNVLGNTIAEIAREKAGIIKEGRPVVVSPQKEEALSVVNSVAEQRHAPVISVGKDIHFCGLNHSLTEQELMLWTNEEQTKMDGYLENATSDWAPIKLQTSLLGSHQIQNAATAYAALNVAMQSGLPISREALLKGFKNTRWPGRFEIVHEDPYVVFDSAHNRDSAQRLRLTLCEYFPGRKVFVLFGVSEDKDVPGMFQELLPGVAGLVAAQASTQRAMPVEKIVGLAHQYGKPAEGFTNVNEALISAYRKCGDDGVLLITGSMFLVAEARRAWDEFGGDI